MKQLLTLLVAGTLWTAYSFSPDTNKKIVVIDAAHGGKDDGARVSGVSEKEITLQIARKIKALQQNEDVKVVLIRDQDDFKTLAERVAILQQLKPSLVISLHANYAASDNAKKGIEAIISKENKHFDLSLRQALQLMTQMTGDSAAKVSSNNLYILRQAPCPALSLELGYMTNPSDLQYLTSDKGQTEIAQKIVAYING